MSPTTTDPADERTEATGQIDRVQERADEIARCIRRSSSCAASARTDRGPFPDPPSLLLRGGTAGIVTSAALLRPRTPSR